MSDASYAGEGVQSRWTERSLRGWERLEAEDAERSAWLSRHCASDKDRQAQGAIGGRPRKRVRGDRSGETIHSIKRTCPKCGGGMHINAGSICGHCSDKAAA